MSEIAAEVVGQNQPVTEVDSVSSFSFDKLHEQALAKLEGSDTPAATPEQVIEPSTQAASAAEGDVQKVDDQSTSTQIAQLKDTDLVEVEVDGQKVTMTWAEARGGVMRQAAFTKRMQTLAQEREAFQRDRVTQQEAAQQRDALVTVMKDENLLRKFLEAQYPHLVQAQAAAAQAAQQVDPDDIATVGQVKQAQEAAAQQVQRAMEEMKSTLQNEAERITREIEDNAATARLSGEINSTIKGLFTEHPFIEKLIPNAEDVLRFNVLKLKPTTPEETLQAFKDVVAGWVENYKTVVTEQNKTTVLNKQKLVQNNILPPGGTAVTPQPTDFKKTNKMTGKTELDWSKLHEAALVKFG